MRNSRRTEDAGGRIEEGTQNEHQRVLLHVITRLLTSSIVDGICPAALDPMLTPSVLLAARTKAEAAMVPYVLSGYKIDTRSVGWYLHSSRVGFVSVRGFLISYSGYTLARNLQGMLQNVP